MGEIAFILFLVYLFFLIKFFFDYLVLRRKAFDEWDQSYRKIRDFVINQNENNILYVVPKKIKNLQEHREKIIEKLITEECYHKFIYFRIANVNLDLEQKGEIISILKHLPREKQDELMDMLTS